jgi:hypothetical protein
MEATKGLSNINFKGRVKQILVLFLVIVACIAVSYSVQAQSYHQSKSKHYKSKYKKQIRQNDKVCNILAKKRTQEPKQPLFAFLKGKPKYKPQAEVDAPSYVAKHGLTAQATKKTDGVVRE